MLMVQLGFDEFFTPCGYWNTLFFMTVYCYWEVFFYHYVVTFTERSVLKEVRILYYLPNANNNVQKQSFMLHY